VSTVATSVKLFKDSNRKIADVPHSGQAGTAATACSEQKVNVFNTEDQRMMVREIVVSLGILRTAIQGDKDC
jgi:hypothetical protein